MTANHKRDVDDRVLEAYARGVEYGRWLERSTSHPWRLALAGAALTVLAVLERWWLELLVVALIGVGLWVSR